MQLERPKALLGSAPGCVLTGSRWCGVCLLATTGTYWDKAGGCLRGSWVAGNLKGQGQYDQPHYHFEGQFAKGLPAGASVNRTQQHCRPCCYCAAHAATVQLAA
jgi:hypothetical protein